MGGRLRGTASVLLPGMHLLAQLTATEPALALSLVQLQVPGDAQEASADLLTLSAAGLSLQGSAVGLSDTEALQLYGKSRCWLPACPFSSLCLSS
jgi:hypothetical protein